MKATGKFVQIAGQRFQIWKSHYPSNDTIAIILCPGTTLGDHNNSHVLSVNMDHGQDHESGELPENCFYVPTWRQEMGDVRVAALLSGHFKTRPDLPPSFTGYEYADAWEYIE